MNKININGVVFVSVGAFLVAIIIGIFGVSTANAAITSNLAVGSRGSQVTELQQFLATNESIYPSGIISGFYGPLTKEAVKQYQLAYNISPVGSVGPVTRASINNVRNTESGLDVSAPVIYGPNVSVSGSNVTINWSTNEYSRGKLYYGTSPIVVTNTFDTTGINFSEPVVTNAVLAAYDGVSRLSQSVTINNLMPNTTYYYRIIALDAANNSSITLQNSFRVNQ